MATYQPQTHLREVFDSKAAALLVIDIQNFCSHKKGAGHAHSAESDTATSQENRYYWKTLAEDVIPNIKRLQSAFRSHGGEIVYTVMESLTKDGRDRSLDYKISGFNIPKGSWDAQVIDEIRPLEDEITLSKSSCSVFVSTNIDYILRNLGVKYLVIVGGLTDQCIESAVRDACDLGYLVTLVSDACITESLERHTNSLATVKGFCRQRTTSQLLRELEAPTALSPAVTSAFSTPTQLEVQHTAAGSQLPGVKLVRILWCDGSGVRRCRMVPTKRLLTETSSHLTLESDSSSDEVAWDQRRGAPAPNFIQSVDVTKLMSARSQLHPIVARDQDEVRPSQLLHPPVACGPSDEIRLVPDLSTLRILPWHPSHAIVIGDMQIAPGEAWECCPRACLRRATLRLEQELHLQLRVGFESEFLLLKDGLPIDQSVYCSSLAADKAAEVTDEMYSALEELGIEVEQLHPESAPGQFEIVTAHLPAMQAADSLLLTRETIAAVAAKHGMEANFSPKLISGAAGSGCHAHMSLWEGDVNILTSRESSVAGVEVASGLPEHSRSGKGEEGARPGSPQDSIPEVASAFFAGVLHHLPALLSVVAPSPASYRRIVPCSWSGAYQCWGLNNREAPLRAACPPWSSTISNFELKSMDGMANPHIALGSVIFAGLELAGKTNEGLTGRSRLPDPIQVDPATLKEPLQPARLPATLKEAVEAMQDDTRAKLRQAIGSSILRAVMATRLYEELNC
ncbi:hypothetical protein CYMTET_48429 [Cymbomonas tetramitiformis]|uniref:GS catalytic domain-containing protein n=1 Tax=Cymbomonas tetramitiformis TaxID=36881 RepID=A0AAE0BU05_9CHLO|nr:hypothetical protein CYMTET_48429 [Cymbomonas tetramitiformis]